MAAYGRGEFDGFSSYQADSSRGILWLHYLF